MDFAVTVMKREPVMSKKREIPIFAHPQLKPTAADYLEGERLEAALQAAHAARVERIITIAVSPDNLDKVMALAAIPTKSR